MGRPSACCCCFSNNVRHLILLISLFCTSCLFANMILFNFTAVFHTDLNRNWQPVQGLDSLHEYSIWHDRRLRRSINGSLNMDKESTSGEGHPILPPIALTTTTQTSPPPSTVLTTRRVVYITNSPTRMVRETTATEQTTTTSTINTETTTIIEQTTTTTTPPITTTRNVVLEEVQKAIDKYEHKDKDADYASSKNEESKSPKLDPTNAPHESNLMRALLYSAPGLGCIIGFIPMVLSIRSLGSRKTMFAVMMLSAIATAATPFLVQYGFVSLFPLRLIAGLSLSASLTFIGSLAANWGTVHEQLTFIMTSLLFIVLAPICSWPLSELLISNEVNLIWIYILHTVVTVIASVIFVIFFRDQPQQHPWVNGLELNRIVAGKVQELKKNRAHAAPVAQLARSLAAWSIWLAAFAFFSAVSLFSTFSPSFLAAQQIFLVDRLAMYSVVPYLGIPVCIIIGAILNRFSCSTSTAHVRIFNTVAFLSAAVLIGILPILFYADNSGVALHVLFVSLAPLGLIVCGFVRSATIVGRVFSQHIVAGCSVSFGLASIIQVVVVNCFVYQNALAEWMRVFFLCSGLLVVSAIVFAIFGRGRSSSWAESTWDPLVSSKMTSLGPINVSQDECGLFELRTIGKDNR